MVSHPNPLPAPPDVPVLEQDWDLIVIGAGPAGAAAAIQAAKLGCKTLLVDSKSFPRRKVCGGCMNLVSVGHLERLIGGQHAIWECAVPVPAYHLMHRRQNFRFELPGGCSIDRAELDLALVEVAKEAGVCFLAPATAVVDGVAEAGATVRLTVQNRHETIVRGRAIVVAGGLGCTAVSAFPRLQSEVAKHARVGIAATLHTPPGSYAEPGIYMAVADAGYVGLSQVSGNRLHLAAAVDRQALQRRGPQRLMMDILESAGAPALDWNEATSWRGTPPLTAHARHVAQDRIFLVGDAAGYIEPFTGEGLRWALATGIEVANYCSRIQQESPHSLAAEWEAWYRRHIARDQRRCQRIAAGVRSRSIRWFAHQLLRWRPAFANPIIHGLNFENV